MPQAAFVEIAAGSNKARVLFGYGLNDLMDRSVKSSNLLAVRSNTMARLVVMYRAPKDFVAFDRHYFEEHRIGSATPITIDIGAIFPFTDVPAYNLSTLRSGRYRPPRSTWFTAAS
jgi:hypothetical protein